MKSIKYQRKVSRAGNGYAVSIPRELARAMEIEAGQTVEISASSVGNLVIVVVRPTEVAE